MSKYGNLRKGDGTHSKFFLTRTLAEHDDTMCVEFVGPLLAAPGAAV
jgi:hypothetical protein